MVASSRLGYSLIELSMVLVAVAGMGAGGLAINATREQQERAQITAERLDLLDETLARYVTLNGNLPCPARADIGSSEVDPYRKMLYGVTTSCAAAAPTGTVDRSISGDANDALRFGAVPTRDLSLPDELGYDGWGNRITYGALKPVAVPSGIIENYDTATPRVLPIADEGGNAVLGSENGDQVAYALLSHGRDGSGAWQRGGTLTPCTAGQADSANCQFWTGSTLSALTDRRVSEEAGPNHFDDYLRFRPIRRLILPDLAIDTVPSVATGEDFTCALNGVGRIYCWGTGTRGQLAGGSTASGAMPPLPILRLRAARAVAAGDHHACAVDNWTHVWCWGANESGELGDGTTTDHAAPVRVTGLTGATSVYAGASHSCALLNDGTVRCWGLNGDGQLGDGSLTTRTTPVAVSGLTGVTRLAIGAEHGCALKGDGSVWCWGSNARGQIGNGLFADRTTPVQASTLPDAVDLAAGAEHSCALGALGLTECWGRNDRGQLGINTVIDIRLPILVVGAITATALDAGGNNSCALRADGVAWCWGDTQTGQLAYTSILPKLLPTLFPGFGNLKSIDPAAGHVCAITTANDVWCWGDDRKGQAYGDGSSASAPHKITLP